MKDPTKRLRSSNDLIFQFELIIPDADTVSFLFKTDVECEDFARDFIEYRSMNTEVSRAVKKALMKKDIEVAVSILEKELSESYEWGPIFLTKYCPDTMTVMRAVVKR